MKKKHHLLKILSAFSLIILLGGCATLSYVDTDYQTVKSANVQTDENFNIQTFEKTSEDASVKIGVTETMLDNVLVLYINIKNNADIMHKFDLNDIKVASPIGEVSFIPPSRYIDAYQNLEARNYAGMVNASTQLTSFANIQSQYRQNASSTRTLIENRNQSPELLALENTISGIQRHSITSYKFINPNSSEYFYIFLVKPEEYPLTVQYKDLTYKFGNKKDARK